MAKYRKKPVVIDAVQFTPHSDFATWNKHGYWNHKIGTDLNGVVYLVTECGIYTASGFVKLDLGDWICNQRVKGKIDRWPVKPDIFEATYEAA